MLYQQVQRQQPTSQNLGGLQVGVLTHLRVISTAEASESLRLIGTFGEKTTEKKKKSSCCQVPERACREPKQPGLDPSPALSAGCARSCASRGWRAVVV